MTGPEHYRRDEELAAEAHKLLDREDGQIAAGVWAAVAQTHLVPRDHLHINHECAAA